MEKMQRPPKKFVPVPYSYHQEVELTISSLTNLGSGVARSGGWVVFVDYALPGETVIASIFRNEKNCSYGDLIKVVAPSPDRVEPRCELFGKCGGCQYQHLKYAKQLEWKSRQVADLLKHMGGMEFPVNPCITTEQIWRYRSKITPHFMGPRDGQISDIGFLQNGYGRRLIDVPQCEIATAEINAALPRVREQVRAAAAEYKRGSTVLMRSHDGGMTTDFNAVISTTVSGVTFSYNAGGFFQNNSFILEKFIDYVATQASTASARFLVDAYCGCGLFSLCLAKRFEAVLGVEINAAAIDWARQNAAANQIGNADFMLAGAEAVFADVSFPADQTAVIIDPPRAGCSPAFIAQLAKYAPQILVYVSCDPATQVRDVKALAAFGYVLTAAQPFDFFPHTRHIESVMTLRRA